MQVCSLYIYGRYAAYVYGRYAAYVYGRYAAYVYVLPKKAKQGNRRNSMVLTCVCFFSVAVIQSTMTQSRVYREGLFGLMVPEPKSPSWQGCTAAGSRERLHPQPQV